MASLSSSIQICPLNFFLQKPTTSAYIPAVFQQIPFPCGVCSQYNMQYTTSYTPVHRLPTKADHTTVLTRNINRNPATSVSISVVFPGNSHDLNSRQVSNVMTGRRTHQYESVESSHSSSLVFIVFCSEASSSSSSVEVSRSSFCRVVGSSSESLSSAMPRVLRRLSSVSAVYIICNTPFHTS